MDDLVPPELTRGTGAVATDVLKVAVMFVVPEIVTWQLPVPPQFPPLHPAKTDPLAGLAVRITFVPVVNADEQVEPQDIPDGLLVTIPFPEPDLEIESVYDEKMAGLLICILTGRVMIGGRGGGYRITA